MLLLHDKQLEVIKSKARFKIIRAGRRSGKSVLETEDMTLTATSGNDRPIFYIAPTQIQARDIVWEIMRKRLTGFAEFNEQRLEIKTRTKDGGYSTIKLAGWENRENFRGKPAYKIVFDEVDTMKDFFIGWQEIFRPALIDFGGGAIFLGTPKKENPNLRRLEKIAQSDKDYACFHFTSLDNPFLPQAEKEKAKKELDYDTYQQEIMAEYLDNAGSLFHYDALVDVFSNTIVKEPQMYMTVDIADDGSDKTIFSFWEGLEEYKREEFERLNTELIISKIREYAVFHRIPFSHIAVDTIGVGAGVGSSSLLDGIVAYKSSYAPIKTDVSPVLLPNVHYTKDAKLTSDYKNLRSQCIFELSRLVNDHKIASKCTGRQKEAIIEELSNYQEVQGGDSKRMATPKEKVKEIIGHSPDASDCFIMRMYFQIRSKMSSTQSPELIRVRKEQEYSFSITKHNQVKNSNR